MEDAAYADPGKRGVLNLPGFTRSIDMKTASGTETEWLHSEANLAVLESEKITASDRRMLMTRWPVDGWVQWLYLEYNNCRLRAFEKTSCLIGLHPGDDAKVIP